MTYKIRNTFIVLPTNFLRMLFFFINMDDHICYSNLSQKIHLLKCIIIFQKPRRLFIIRIFYVRKYLVQVCIFMLTCIIFFLFKNTK